MHFMAAGRTAARTLLWYVARASMLRCRTSTCTMYHPVLAPSVTCAQHPFERCSRPRTGQTCRYRKLANTHGLPCSDLAWTSFRARYCHEAGRPGFDSSAATGQTHRVPFHEVEFALVAGAQFMCRVPASYGPDEVEAIVQGKARARAPLLGTDGQPIASGKDADEPAIALVRSFLPAEAVTGNFRKQNNKR
jgi:hypothetical protein